MRRVWQASFGRYYFHESGEVHHSLRPAGGEVVAQQGGGLVVPFFSLRALRGGGLHGYGVGVGLYAGEHAGRGGAGEDAGGVDRGDVDLAEPGEKRRLHRGVYYEGGVEYGFQCSGL